MERAEVSRIERVINHELTERFAAGAVRRAVLLQHGDDPAIEPGQLMVRVLIPAPAEPGDDEQALAAWQGTHQPGMDALRRELSLRLPSARLLEFTFDEPGTTARIAMPDDGTLAAEQLSGRQIVTRALALLRANYVFPELADRAATAVEARLAAGEYDNLDEVTLTELLTRHLRETCDDKHLRVRLGGGPQGRPGGGGPRPRRGHSPGADWRPMGGLDNFGIHRVERLGGNIGYLDLRRVPAAAHAGPAVAAAMELVAGTYALIIDLRRNGGGAVEGVVLWCSYLLGEEPVHLNDIYRADTGETRQFWSLPSVPGRRYLDRPVYVLASGQTFSGGEDFCYTLQALGRAEVIGETTGGGAHPTRPFPISPAVHIGIPFARSINPVTGTNWQGTGVIPDIAVPEAEARDTAYAQALRHVLGLDDVPPPVADEARDALGELPATG